MKARVVILLVSLLAFSVCKTTAQATIERMFTELKFEAAGWKLEMHPPCPHVLNGWFLQTKSGRAYFKSGIRIDTGYVIITNDSLLNPLTINPLIDTLSISDGSLTRQGLIFGHAGSGVIAAPRSGQSLCLAPDYSNQNWYLDNTPTLGHANDFINAMGIVQGVLSDSSGSPIRNVRVSCRDGQAPSVYSDSMGRFTFTDCARVENLSFVHPAFPALLRSLQVWPESTVTLDLTLQSRSLVDLFPLAIGHQWLYRYDYEFRDIGVITQYSDTGTVNLRIFDKVAAIDSIRWLVEETGRHWTCYDSGSWWGPTVRIDTFEIVESTVGNHPLYRTGEIGYIRGSVLPFVPDLVDTARIFRYAAVDSTGILSFVSRESPGVPVFFFRFQRSIGLTAVSMSDGMTGFPFYWTDHSLRSWIISEVADPRQGGMARSYALYQNYPNPFNPTTTIRYQLATASRVSLKVYDVLGREVATLVNDLEMPGVKSVRFDGSKLASGLYLYRLQAGSFVAVKKLILLK